MTEQEVISSLHLSKEGRFWGPIGSFMLRPGICIASTEDSEDKIEIVVSKKYESRPIPFG